MSNDYNGRDRFADTIVGIGAIAILLMLMVTL